MKKSLKYSSILCLLIAVVMFVLGIRALTTRSVFMGLAIFSMARSGTFMSFMGNIIGILFTVGGYGLMGFHGINGGTKSCKTGLCIGAVMAVVCLISLFCSIATKRFNFGDILMLLLPIWYCLGVFANKD